MGVELDQDWPGVTEPGGTEVVDLDALAELGTALRREAELMGMNVAGSIDRLIRQNQQLLERHSFGMWSTARNLEHGHATAVELFQQYYRALADQLKRAADVVTAIAGAHAGADDATHDDLHATAALLDLSSALGRVVDGIGRATGRETA